MTPKQKAELFNSYSCSVFRPLKALSIPDDSPLLLSPVEQLSDKTVSEEEVAHHHTWIQLRQQAPMVFLLGYRRNAVIPLPEVFARSLIIHCILVLFHLNGTQLMFHQFIKKIRTSYQPPSNFTAIYHQQSLGAMRL